MFRLFGSISKFCDIGFKVKGHFDLFYLSVTIVLLCYKYLASIMALALREKEKK